MDCKAALSETAGDMDRFRAYSREHAEVPPVVERFDAWRQAESDLAAADEMAAEPSMKAFAHEERAAAGQRETLDGNESRREQAREGESCPGQPEGRELLVELALYDGRNRDGQNQDGKGRHAAPVGAGWAFIGWDIDWDPGIKFVQGSPFLIGG